MKILPSVRYYTGLSVYKTTGGVLTFRVDRCLSSESFQHFGCPRQSVPTLTNTDIQAELLHLQLLHRVLTFRRLILHTSTTCTV